EQRLSAMDAVKRNRDYASMTDAPQMQTAPIRNLWYNTFVYMTIFGLVGGLLAWGCGAMLRFKPSAFLESSEMMKNVQEVRAAADAGTPPPAEKAAQLAQLAREGRNNPYFVIYSDERLSEADKRTLISQVAARDRKKEFISNVLAYGMYGMLIA